MRLNGDAIDEADERGERVVGDTLMVMLNAHPTDVSFQLPPASPNERWETLLDTATPDCAPSRIPGGEPYALRGRSVAILKLSARNELRRRQQERSAEPLTADSAELMAESN
jgi:isoamylase